MHSNVFFSPIKFQIELLLVILEITLNPISSTFLINTGSLPYLCVAAKHGNACGMGVSSDSPSEALEKALWGNPVAIWGGELITNFPIDEALSSLLFKSDRREKLFGKGVWMLDVIIAPSFTAEAISILGKRKERKLIANQALSSPSILKTGFLYRQVRGGFLRQPMASYVLNIKECQCTGCSYSCQCCSK